MTIQGEEEFEVGARYRTRVDIDALRDRFAAGEVLVYWRFGSSRYDDARGWFFRQAGSSVVRSYDLLGGEPLRRDALFEKIAGPSAIVTAALADDASTIEGLLDVARAEDDNELLDREIATELALVLDRPAATQVLIQQGTLAKEVRLRLLLVAARAGRGPAIRALLATGLGPDEAPPSSQTALVAAVFGKHIDAIAVLLAAGADPDLPQASGPTPRAFAKDPAILALLPPARN